MSDDPEARRRAIDDLQRAIDETVGGITPEKRRDLRRALRREKRTRESRKKG